MTIEFPGRPDLPDTPERAAAIQAAHAREAEVRARSVVFPVYCIGRSSEDERAQSHRPEDAASHAPVCVGELGVTNLGEAYTSGRVTVTFPTDSGTLESHSVTHLPACPTCGRGPTRVTDDGVLEMLEEAYRKRRRSFTVSQIDAVMARHAEGHTSP